MKLWLKYLIGIGIGLAFAVLFPQAGNRTQNIVSFAVELVIRLGRFTLVPVLFFSVVSACYRIREEKMILKTSLWTFGTIASTSFILMLLGVISAFLVKLPRIPITTERVSEAASFTWVTLVTKLFPFSGFESLIDGAYLLPAFAFALLIGFAAAGEKGAAKPAVVLFDSLARIMYIVMSFFTELLAVGMIAVMTKWTWDSIAIIKTGVYNYLIIMLTVNLLLVAFVLYPVILRLLCHETHPYRVLYAAVCPFLVAFFSGDTNLSLALALRHGKESLGIRRRVNAFTFPLFSVFGRGGAALVQVICFILILRSYSSLGIPVADAIWIGLISFVLSFALGEIPSGGPFVAITAMCLLYGRNFESGYLLLKNAAPLICAFACGIDALTAIFGSYIVSVKTQSVSHQELRKFI